MKKLEHIKTIQLIIYVAVAAWVIFSILTDSDISKIVADNPEIGPMRTVICVLLALGFLFLFFDITIEGYRAHLLTKLVKGSSTDSIASISNRNSIDEEIKKYWDEELPERLCCMMFELTSLIRANDRHTRKEGDRQIRAFSLMLKKASPENCFVGRNGGNVFLAIFENGKKRDFSNFLDRIEEQVGEYNSANDNSWIRYRFGIAYNWTERVDDISKLISIASEKSKTAQIRPDETGNFSDYTHYQ